MSDQKYSFIVVAYEGKDTGVEAMETLHELGKQHEIKVRDAVVVYKNHKGKIKLHPKNDLTAKKGGLTGATAGLIIGFAMGGPALGAAVGAATGAVAGNISGIEKEVKHLLEDTLQEEDSALCVLVKYAHWQVVREEMARYHGHVVVSELNEEAAAAFEEMADQEEVAQAVAEELKDTENDAEDNEDNDGSDEE